MGRMTRSLIERLHTPLQPGAEPSFAFRVHHPWSLRENTLTVDGVDFDLTGKTIRELTTELDDVGLDVIAIADGVAGYAALILADGEGDVRSPIRAHTQLLPVLFAATGESLADARDTIPIALAQLILTTARAEFLELYGDIFGIRRLPGQTDPEYAQHIIDEVKRPRSNAYAIRANVRRRIGAEVGVEEPWRYVARFSDAALSDDKRFYHGDRWAPHLIHLTAHDSIDWGAAQAIADQDRAAGVVLLDPAWMPLARHVAGSFGPLPILRTDHYSYFGSGIWEPIWSYSELDAHSVTRDFSISWADVFGSYTDGAIVGIALWDSVTRYCRGWATLSEDTALGHEDTTWAGGWYRDVLGDARVFSDDFAASDYNMRDEIRPICDWTISEQMLGVDVSGTEASQAATVGKALHSAVTALSWGYPIRPRQWGDDGTWGDRSWSWYPDRSRFVPSYVVRRCAQRDDGASPILSDEGALSDYVDGITCEPLTEFVSSQPEAVCTQAPNALTPTLSDDGALSDYVDGKVCDARMSLTERSALYPCQQHTLGRSPVLSVSGPLSDYFDELVCTEPLSDPAFTYSDDGVSFSDDSTTITLPQAGGLTLEENAAVEREEAGAPPALSVTGRLSDYVHSLS